MTIGGRLRQAIEHDGRSLREFADGVGLNYGTLLQYLSDKRTPNGEALAQIASRTNIDMHWLLTGRSDGRAGREGDAHQANTSGAVLEKSSNDLFGDSETPPARQYATRHGAPGVIAEAAEVYSANVGLGEWALLAASGRQAGAWALLKVLAASHPTSLSSSELAISRNTPETVIVQDLLLLRRYGLVKEAGGRFGLTSLLAELRPKDVGDVAQVIQVALEELLRTIAPRVDCERPSGTLVTATVAVPAGTGEDLIRAIKRDIKRRWANASADGGADQVTLVLGMAALPGGGE